MEFNQKIILKANEFFELFSEGEIFRGQRRKSIIFACIYFAFKESNNYKTPEKLRIFFGINNTLCLKGIKIVYLK